MSYKKGIVIFIDVLGTKERENDFKNSLKINNIFHNTLEDGEKHNNGNIIYQRHVYTFSDCAYIIYDYKEDIEESRKDWGKLTKAALYNTELIIEKFLKKNLISRGGISYGDVYYEENRSLFFGPAINEAHELESKEAIYPRIIVSPKVAQLYFFRERDFLYKESSPEQREFARKINGVILKRDEKKFMLHYLNSYELGHNYLELEEKFNELLIYIENQLEKYKNNNRILEKYEWLKKYVENSKPKFNSGNIMIEAF